MIIVLITSFFTLCVITTLIITWICTYNEAKWNKRMDNITRKHNAVWLQQLPDDDRAKYNKADDKRRKWRNLSGKLNAFDSDSILCYICAFALVIAVVGITIIFVVSYANFSTFCVRQTVEDMTQTREMLIYRLGHPDQSTSGNELLYSDILEYNKRVYRYRRDCDNPWCSWLCNKRFAEFELIDYQTIGNVD